MDDRELVNQVGAAIFRSRGYGSAAWPWDSQVAMNWPKARQCLRDAEVAIDAIRSLTPSSPPPSDSADRIGNTSTLPEAVQAPDQ